MVADDDLDGLAAEYVLGTLTVDERATVEQLAAKDSDFAGRIAYWERRLGVLEEMVEPVEPPPELWNRIREKVAQAAPDGTLQLPELAAVTAAREAEAGKVVALSRRVRRWRGVAALTGAVAAALLLVAGLGRYRPDLLPEQLKPPVRTQVVEKVVERVVEKVVEVPQPPPPAPGRFVAVLQRDAGAPAFLLTVDLGERTLTVRRVTPPEPGKSHELWLVSDRFPAPRSLGVVGAGEFTQPAALASYDQATINSATYAISLEPEGGSPTGAPTGPVLFTGKLVEAVPPRP